MYLYYADPSANRPDPLPPPAAGSYRRRVLASSPYGGLPSSDSAVVPKVITFQKEDTRPIMTHPEAFREGRVS